MAPLPILTLALIIFVYIFHDPFFSLSFSWQITTHLKLQALPLNFTLTTDRVNVKISLHDVKKMFNNDLSMNIHATNLH
ncbi:hypothetical protein SOPP22_17655 [Shewanella sp. OPT22]|nr:hypothetical protein SOPP22_17655 [Shewanella sp. OPT22]